MMKVTLKNTGLAIILLTHIYLLFMQKGMSQKEVMYHALTNLAAFGMLIYK